MRSRLFEAKNKRGDSQTGTENGQRSIGRDKGVRITQKGLRYRYTLTAALFVLALALAGCGDSESRSSSEVESPAETTAPTAAVTGATTGEETSPRAAQATQQVVDQANGVDALDAYTRALRAARSAYEPASCEPTQPDMLGPYYVPDAPMRTSVDTGYVLSGNVLSADGCEPIPGARIEFWLADPHGNYDDAHRATVLAGEQGEYRFQSNFPGRYENRPPHIHVRVTAPGFQELVTQHYPEAGQTEATFDLVLEPA